jgi:aromatic-L-amino-acid/L-tryptophan decarboxylase
VRFISADTSRYRVYASAHPASLLAIRARGMAARATPKLRLYTSKEAHSSIEKGTMILGIGQENVRKIETDISFRMP